MGQPEVSVVVSTYQRAGALRGLLESLEAQSLDRDRFEVVLVDNGSTDETTEVLGRLVRSSPLDVRVHRVETNRGPAAGREAGVRVARAPIIGLTDDDCRPEPDWLATGLAAMKQGAVVVAGTVRPPADAEVGPFSRVVGIYDARYLATSNIFYWRDDIEAVGGFDDAYGSVGGEDTDLGLRVLARHGLSEATYRSDVVVIHPVTPSRLSGALRTAWRWHDLPLLFKRHPHLRDTVAAYRRYFWKPSHPRAILVVAAVVMAFTSVIVGARALVLAATLGLLAALLAAPWVLYRIVQAPLTPSPSRRIATLPGALLIDLVEVCAMLRGSIKHRTLLL